MLSISRPTDIAAISLVTRKKKDYSLWQPYLPIDWNKKGLFRLLNIDFMLTKFEIVSSNRLRELVVTRYWSEEKNAMKKKHRKISRAQEQSDIGGLTTSGCKNNEKYRKHRQHRAHWNNQLLVASPTMVVLMSMPRLCFGESSIFIWRRMSVSIEMWYLYTTLFYNMTKLGL